MVEGLWKTGVTARVLSALYGLYSRSVFYALLARFAAAVKSSRTAYYLLAVLHAPPAGVTRYELRLAGLNRLAAGFSALAGRSLCAAAVRSAGRGLARVTRGSLIFGALRRLGARRFMLVIFALFLPVDALLRSSPLPAVIPALWDELLLFAMLAYAFHDEAVSGRRPGITPPDAPFMLFFGIGVFLLMFVSPDLTIGVNGFRAVFQFMLFFPALVRMVKNERDFNIIYITILITGAVLALHGIYQYIAAVPIPANWVSVYEAGVRTRSFSIVGSPNILGDFMVMTAPLAAAMAYKVRTPKMKLFYWVCFALMCACCVFTFSRGAWVGLIAAAVVFALLVDRRMIVLMLFAGGIALLIPEIANRLMFLFTPEFQSNNESGGRAMRWEYGLELLRDSGAALGVGLGRFGGAVAMQNQVENGWKYFYLDNYYMKTYVEMGAAGLTGYILLLLSSLWMGLRSVFRCVKNISVQAAGLLAAVCGVLAHCFFENIFEVPYMNAYFWAFLALMACCGFVWKREE